MHKIKDKDIERVNISRYVFCFIPNSNHSFNVSTVACWQNSHELFEQIELTNFGVLDWT